MRARVGSWVIEDEKRVKLYIVRVEGDRVMMSYRPGDPIAVSVSKEDFRIFFSRCKGESSCPSAA